MNKKDTPHPHPSIYLAANCRIVTLALAGLLALVRETNLRDARAELGINEKASILLINTEADTDPANFQTIVGEAA